MSQNASNATQKFLKGTVILSVAGLIAKILGASFRIPLGNLIKNVGMGYYGGPYPIYTLLTAIAIVGIPSTIAKLVAEKRVAGEYQAAHDIFTYTLRLMIGIGIVISLLMALCSQGMIYLFKWEQETIYSILGLSLSPLFVCMMGVFRGYFQGRQDMTPTAISQVLENLGRFLTGLSLAYLFMPDAGKAAGGASFGATAGGMLGVLALFIIYMMRKMEIKKEIELSKDYNNKSLSFRNVAQKVLFIAIPISIGAAVNSIMNFADSALVQASLKNMGMTNKVATEFQGQLTKVATFINLPLAFGMALVIGLVPAITEAVAKKDKGEVQTKIELGMRFALLIGLPASIGLSVLSSPIMKLVYYKAPDGWEILSVAALSIVFIMLGQAFTGILQGIGKVWQPVIGIILATIAKVILNIILMQTSLQVIGTAIASIIAYFIFMLYNYQMMKKYTSFKLNIKLVIIKPLIASIIMGVVAGGTYKGLSLVMDATSRTNNAIMTLAGIGAGAISYVVLIFILGAVTKQDLKDIKGKGSAKE